MKLKRKKIRLNLEGGDKERPNLILSEFDAIKLTKSTKSNGNTFGLIFSFILTHLNTHFYYFTPKNVPF